MISKLRSILRIGKKKKEEGPALTADEALPLVLEKAERHLTQTARLFAECIRNLEPVDRLDFEKKALIKRLKRNKRNLFLQAAVFRTARLSHNWRSAADHEPDVKVEDMFKDGMPPSKGDEDGN